MNKNLFTTEFVTEGHPDKVADQISDQILDNILEIDANARVAAEVLGSGNLITIGGEITANLLDYAKSFVFYPNGVDELGLHHFKPQSWFKLHDLAASGFVAIEDVPLDLWNTFALEVLALSAIEKVYDRVGYSLNGIKVRVNIQAQSPDIALGTNDDVGGAGDQGFVFGYATDETENYMPFGYEVARCLARKLEEVRHKGLMVGLMPDGKTQVTLDLDTRDIYSIVISNQHNSIWNDNMDGFRTEIMEKVILPVLEQYNIENKDIIYYINHTGKFEIGGFEGDAGLTGRKIIVDTYGGYTRHGGGAFSGKSSEKVDRSGAYMARYIAKNIVAAGYAKQVSVQIGYVIGHKQPVSLQIDSIYLTPKQQDNLWKQIMTKLDLSPKGIIDKFSLKEPIYHKVSSGGHFGKEDLPWEKIDLF